MVLLFLNVFPAFIFPLRYIVFMRLVIDYIGEFFFNCAQYKTAHIDNLPLTALVFIPLRSIKTSESERLYGKFN